MSGLSRRQALGLHSNAHYNIGDEFKKNGLWAGGLKTTRSIYI